jgi:hypothetical protein
LTENRAYSIQIYTPLLANTLSSTICLTIVLLFLIPSNICYGQENNKYEEVSVFFNIQEIGTVDIMCYIKDNNLYLPVTDLFTFLHIQNSTTQELDSITGYYINPTITYSIDQVHNFIRLQDKIFPLEPEDILRTDNSIYLRSDYFGTVFGLTINFDFRSLSATMKTLPELPLIKEMRQELMRRNIRRLKGEIKADTMINREYPFFRFGMIDWSVVLTELNNKLADTRVNLSLGAILAGGEANIGLNYSKNLPFLLNEQFYQWHFVNNDLRIAKQIMVGKIQPDAISSLPESVLGAQVTNTPTTYRRSFCTYTLSDYTEPNWIVELYVNYVLIEYTKADASGFFTFEVPLVYGTSVVKLRFYGPWGEERSREQNITVPMNFLPPKVFEYKLSSGVIQELNNAFFSRLNVNYGLSKRITVGGGLEYNASIFKQPAMPFVNFSARLASALLLSGEYVYGVKVKSILNYRLRSGIFFELFYTKYQQNQMAVINNYYQEERKASVSIPINTPHFNAFIRMMADQIILDNSKYLTTQFIASGSLFGINTNFTTYGQFSRGIGPYVYSELSLTLRLPGGFIINPLTQYQYSAHRFTMVKLSVEKRVFQSGVVNFTYEHNLRNNSPYFQLGFKYDFPFAQTGVSGNNSAIGNSFVEYARGSLLIDSKNSYLGFSNRTNVGKGGLEIVAFLDLNCNGKRDKGEYKVNGLKLHLTGGLIKTDDADTVIRVMNLEPFTSYFLELDRNSFDNVAWQIKNVTISVAIDPNQFKLVEIPVAVLGEVSGMVYVADAGGQRGQGRIIVNLFRSDSTLFTRTETESDGYFNYLGLPPGSYYLQVDRNQLERLTMKCTEAKIPFMIRQNKNGDQVEDLEITLVPEVEDSTVLVARANKRRTNPVFDSRVQSQAIIPTLKPASGATIQAKQPAKDTIYARSAMPDTMAHKTDSSLARNDRATIIPPETPIGISKAVPIYNPDSLLIADVKFPVRESVVKQSPENMSDNDTIMGFLSDSCGFGIQVGAFENQENALQTAQLLDHFNRPVMITREENFYKVRITGFGGRKEAKSFIPELTDKGFAETILINNCGFSVQLGAFHNKTNAVRLLSKLSEKVSQHVAIVSEGEFYKVRVLGFTNYNNAKLFIPGLRKLGFNEFYIVKSR